MKKSFIVHIDSLAVLDDLSDEQCGELFRAIKAYHSGEEIELSPLTKIAFSPFKNQFARDGAKYENTCKARAAAGSKGGKQKVANASKCKQKAANVADSDSKSKNDSKSDSKNKNEVLVIPDGINQPAWNEWVDYRKSKKKSVSQAAAKKQFKLLSNYSLSDQQSVIDQSISNDYQGLFELKGNSNESNKQSSTNGQTRRDQVRQQGEEDFDTLQRSLQQSHNSGGELVEADGGSLRLTLDHDAGPDH